MNAIARGEHAPNCYGVATKDEVRLPSETRTPFSSMPHIRHTRNIETGDATWYVVFECSWVHCNAELWIPASDILQEAY